MEMISCGKSCFTGAAYYVSLFHRLSLLRIDLTQMRIKAEKIESMIYYNGFAVNAEDSRSRDLAAVRRRNVRLCDRGKIYSEMYLIIDRPIFVFINPIIGESRPALRFGES